MSGDGGLDVVGMLSALPRDIAFSLEVPMCALAKAMPAIERARRILDKTRALLRWLD
ncbi:MAG TPA: hypothetical protein VF014_01650 [Casimicrobiaceae bacterium]|nr:hypothetical protein [Casimicrobiaceae bacterium]